MEGLKTMTIKPATPARRQPRPIGGFTITRMIREHHPLMQSTDGPNSIGAMIDEQLHAHAQRGESIHSLELHFELEQWEQVASEIYCGYVEDC